MSPFWEKGLPMKWKIDIPHFIKPSIDPWQYAPKAFGWMSYKHLEKRRKHLGPAVSRWAGFGKLSIPPFFKQEVGRSFGKSEVSSQHWALCAATIISVLHILHYYFHSHFIDYYPHSIDEKIIYPKDHTSVFGLRAPHLTADAAHLDFGLRTQWRNEARIWPEVGAFPLTAPKRP